MKEQTKIVTLELRTTLTNKQLAAFIDERLFEVRGDVTLTQTPRVQVAQAVRKEK